MRNNDDLDKSVHSRDSEMFNYIIFERQNQQDMQIFVRYGLKKKVRNQKMTIKFFTIKERNLK